MNEIFQRFNTLSGKNGSDGRDGFDGRPGEDAYLNEYTKRGFQGAPGVDGKRYG